jgi:hypothetical protein
LSRSEKFDLLAPKIGQLVNINNPDANEMWWEQEPSLEIAKEKLQPIPV